MDQLLKQLHNDYPAINFVQSRSFYWSPRTQEVFYARRTKAKRTDSYSILHELSHALLGHSGYKNDYELLLMEIDAWEHAKTIAGDYEIEINEDHIQNCLDTYRDWLYKRSVCPLCSAKGIQRDKRMAYWCFNCHHVWRVGMSRFCRPYRYSGNNKNSSATIATDELSWKL